MARAKLFRFADMRPGNLTRACVDLSMALKVERDAEGSLDRGVRPVGWVSGLAAGLSRSVVQ